ncbi:MAG: hypothetical protein MUC38_08200 [Cyclobacteriaceae bacterium]|jgi:uncharacterized protein YjbJ (UPF0337 family)|nr:hypothetical protein [Cyclobacteriaceae bacterium]
MENEKKPKELFTIKGNWEEHAKAMKINFAQLTDADLKFETGKEEELVARVMSRLGKKHGEVVHLLKRTMSAKTV